MEIRKFRTEYRLMTILAGLILGYWWVVESPNTPMVFFGALYFSASLVFFLAQKTEEKRLFFLNSVGMMVGFTLTMFFI